MLASNCSAVAVAVIMFEWLTQAVLNNDERDTTEVPKLTLNAVLDYLFIFYRACI